jgi:hypothetical protein
MDLSIRLHLEEYRLFLEEARLVSQNELRPPALIQFRKLKAARVGFYRGPGQGRVKGLTGIPPSCDEPPFELEIFLLFVHRDDLAQVKAHLHDRRGCRWLA